MHLLKNTVRQFLVMNQYEDMSLVYDKLTQDQPYHSWFNIVEHFLPSDSHDLLDIGLRYWQLNTITNVTR